MRQPHWTAWVLVSLTLAGCTYHSDEGEWLTRPVAKGLVADPHSVLPDVPKPIGFELVESQSEGVMRDGARMVNHKYQGRSTMNEVIEYYRTIPRRHKWKPVREDRDLHGMYMWYTKGREMLESEISQLNYKSTAIVRIRDKNLAGTSSN